MYSDMFSLSATFGYLSSADYMHYMAPSAWLDGYMVFITITDK